MYSLINSPSAGSSCQGAWRSDAIRGGGYALGAWYPKAISWALKGHYPQEPQGGERVTEVVMGAVGSLNGCGVRWGRR